MYVFCRWLILALLSSEIEVLVTYQNPLDTRESLVASMSQVWALTQSYLFISLFLQTSQTQPTS